MSEKVFLHCSKKTIMFLKEEIYWTWKENIFTLLDIWNYKTGWGGWEENGTQSFILSQKQQELVFLMIKFLCHYAFKVPWVKDIWLILSTESELTEQKLFVEAFAAASQHSPSFSIFFSLQGLWKYLSSQLCLLLMFSLNLLLCLHVAKSEWLGIVVLSWSLRDLQLNRITPWINQGKKWNGN